MIKTNLQKSIYNYRKNKKNKNHIWNKKTSSNLSNYPLLYQQQK